MPLRADFATIEYGGFPLASTAGALASIASADGHASVVPGGKARFSIRAGGDLRGVQILVGIEGYDGVLSYAWDMLVDTPAAASPRPGVPLAQSGDAVLSFFLLPGVVPDDVRGH